ncbi:MAG: von Willebrand factor type A domain-containing protein [Devosia sp.]|uniref:YfbK domain-containing protein n=1 Tax=Devosia sp. TaxID=1871048 RepID=UPI001A0CBDBC|nr:von Willebrand factor type A domain-containing protein [Devosia sp.]MBF0678871.1 von Willebrand factor type A domain-containing protein [Devosia sp.]
MSHHDHDPFDALKSTTPPPVRPDARAAALAAARAAYDDAQEEEQAKKSAAPSKGNSGGWRLTSIIASLKGFSIMDARIPLGTAAVALLLFPLGLQFYNSTALTPVGGAAHDPAPAVISDTAGQAPVLVETQPAPPEPAQEAEAMIADAVMPSPQDKMAEAPMVRAPAPISPSIALQTAAAPSPAAGQMLTRNSVDNFGYAPAAEPSGDSFTSFDEQRLKAVADEPVSTFSIDVDTASYAYVRRQLEDGYLPEADAIRIEELLNYFPYDYAAPASADVPFQPTLKVFPTPWNDKTQLLEIGIKGFEPPVGADTKSNLVFLIDTSGSMDAPDKLPLLKRAFALLLDKLSANDTVSIVAYAGSAGIVLEPTSADNKAKILSALDGLSAGGSTAGAEGIELAYRLAEEARVEGTNRVILATDGDFNVGIDDPEALEDFIAEKRQTGTSLSILGFGRGNLDDATMQALAQNGNGNASYISSFAEAKKVLVEEIGGTLHTIAQDVKIQVEFNPAVIAEYRLIGYETRALNREDFNNDAVDAGDIGAGHTVTALYEITPVGSGGEQIDPLRYGENATTSGAGEELAFLKMRYKLPGETVSQLIEEPVTADVVYDDITTAGPDAQFAAAIAAFGQKLKSSVYGFAMTWAEIEALARAGRGDDEGGYRAEFLRLVSTAALLKPDTTTAR